MQYESNPANGFRDIIRKRITDAQTHGRTAIRDDNIHHFFPHLHYYCIHGHAPFELKEVDTREGC